MNSRIWLLALLVGLSISVVGAQQDDAGAEAERLLSEEVVQLDAEVQRRYNDVALKLVQAINKRDAQSYRALFSDAGWESSIPWWRDMFEVQIEKFGKIEKAYVPQRGFMMVGKLGVRGSEETGGATFIVKFEELTGGALTFLLDDKGKIAATDVFIKRDLGNSAPKDVALLYELPG